MCKEKGILRPYGPDDFIRKSKAHEPLGIDRSTLYRILTDCKEKKMALPPLRKSISKQEITGYRYGDLMKWWYKSQTKVIEGVAVA